MCLEDCGNNASDIAGVLRQLATPGVFTDASFEDWDLANGVIVKKSNRSRVSDDLAALGLGAHAMIVSWDLNDIRAAFAAPAAFIESVDALMLASERKITAVNLDFEPHGSNPPVGPAPTKQDGADYAVFLDVFADAMHARGIKVSVDIATWTSFWSYPLIGATRVDYICDMESCAFCCGGRARRCRSSRASLLRAARA